MQRLIKIIAVTAAMLYAFAGGASANSELTDILQSLTGSVTFAAMLDSATASGAITITVSDEPSMTEIYANGEFVNPARYSKNAYLTQRTAKVNVQRGELSSLELAHELSHALDWVLYHDQIVIEDGSYSQPKVYGRYTEAVAITLYNQVALELGLDIRDCFTRSACDFDGVLIELETPIVYGAFPLEYSEQDAQMFNFYGVNVYELYKYFS